MGHIRRNLNTYKDVIPRSYARRTGGVGMVVRVGSGAARVMFVG